jgi:hypothetical protein
VVSQFAARGVSELFVKWLAPNDNSKNQIYVERGRGAEGLFNLFPTDNIRQERTQDGNETIKAAVRFGWLDEEGAVCPAPKAQLILYPQYPEVRLSGFLLGAEKHPGALMTTRLSGRVLLLGVTREKILAAAVFSNESETAKELRSRKLGGEGILLRLQIAGDKRAELIDALRSVHLRGWITSRRLSSNGEFSPCEAPNCGGMTLEAELGIPANSSKEPDYLGWELKAHSATQSSITLMTPEPTGGLYREMTARQFLNRFGRRNPEGGRLDFTGPFQAGKFNAKTPLTLALDGFDAKRERFDAAGRLILVSASGEIAAEWSFAGLLRHWATKHDRVAYVPCLHRKLASSEYQYKSDVMLGQGTRFALLLRAFAEGSVKYDPGIHLDAGKVTPKRRSQFRVGRSNLSTLYDKFEAVNVLI